MLKYAEARQGVAGNRNRQKRSQWPEMSIVAVLRAFGFLCSAHSL